MKNPVLALLSDFGHLDPYVGIMKGEILKLCPRANLVDLSHQVSPQCVKQGAFLLQQALASFPAGTIFLCVVDPGVGSSRDAVAVKAGDFFFVAPDNGLLSRALRHLGDQETVVLETPEKASRTFHGRDIFAPAAGRLAAGIPLEKLGKGRSELVIGSDLAALEGPSWDLEILHIDHFGNVIFDCPRSRAPRDLKLGERFTYASRSLPFAGTYSDVSSQESLFLWNSADHLELAVREGSAARAWDLKIGESCRVVRQV